MLCVELNWASQAGGYNVHYLGRADGYDQLMGRWGRHLAPFLLKFAEVKDGDRVLDVGCGTGSLTRALLAHVPQSEVVGS